MSSNFRTQFNTHQRAAVLENIRFLRDSGLSDEAIARRLDLTQDNLEKIEKRERERKKDRAKQ